MDINLLIELEEMAFNADSPETQNEKVIQTWMSLGYSRSDTETEIASVSKLQVQKAVWKPTAFELRQTVYIILAAPLDTPGKVKAAAALAEMPEVKEGTSEDTGEMVQVCSIGVPGRFAIDSRISRQGLVLKPLFITETKALKNFDSCTCYPTLGIPSTTLPQFRPSSVER